MHANMMGGEGRGEVRIESSGFGVKWDVPVNALSLFSYRGDYNGLYIIR